MNFEKIKFTILPSPPDPRDWKVADVLKKLSLPSELDLRDKLQPVRDQGEQGSCAAMAASCAKEYQERLDVGLDEYMSPQFIYNNRNNSSEGMYTRDVVDILRKLGDCTEKKFPYGSIGKPPVDAYAEALKYPIDGYAWCNTVDELKTALNHNGVVMIAFPVYNFTMRFWYQRPGDYLRGYHMVSVVGYSDIENHFIIRNSWGKDWGENGYTYFPYSDWGWNAEVVSTIDTESDDYVPPLPEPPKKTPWWWWGIGAVIITVTIYLIISG